MDITAIFNSFELNFLSDAVAVVDSRIEALEARTKLSPDSDGEGLFDQIEYLTGFGLVACQAYLTSSLSAAEVNKRVGLEVGPRHACGHSIASLVNALANYWKHSSEWELPMLSRTQKTADLVSSLGADLDAPYVIINAFTELVRPGPPRVARVIPFLAQWQHELP